MTSLNSRANIARGGRSQVSMSTTMGFRNVGTLAESETEGGSAGGIEFNSHSRGAGKRAGAGAVAVHISRATDSDRTAASARSADDKFAEVSG